MNKLSKGYHLNTLLFISPWLIVFLLFQIYPIIYSLFISFTNTKAISIIAPTFVGFKNYWKLLLTRDFQDAVYNSLLFVLGTVPLTMFIAFIVAVLLDIGVKKKAFYSIALFAPTVTSTFVISTLFVELYRDDGAFNWLIQFFGGDGLRWLRDPDTALLSIMIMNVWSSFGFYALVFLAAMQTIPKDFYEISLLEGVGFWKYIKSVVWPHLRLTVLVAALFNAILAFQVFGEIFIMTQGGPINSTKTVVYFIYDEAFGNQKLGYASAAAYIVFIFLMLLALCYMYFTRKRVNIND